VAKQQPARRFTLLYDKVCRQDILQEAWQRVKSNKGAAGGDEVEIDEIREYGEARFLSEIEQELRDDSYRVLPGFMGPPGAHTKVRTAGENSAVGHPHGEGPSGADGREVGNRTLVRSRLCALFIRFSP
jgi:hypothetical protein